MVNDPIMISPFEEGAFDKKTIKNYEELLGIEYIRCITLDPGFDKFVQYHRQEGRKLVLSARYKLYRRNQYFKEDDLPEFSPYIRHIAWLSHAFLNVEVMYSGKPFSFDTELTILNDPVCENSLVDQQRRSIALTSRPSP
jgi:hypothetical protein